jgi:hypothetical protein
VARPGVLTATRMPSADSRRTWRRGASGGVNRGLMAIRAIRTTPKLIESVSEAAGKPANPTSAPPTGPPIMITSWLPDCRKASARGRSASVTSCRGIDPDEGR